ncbi:MAG: glycolate oxidase subunit GlcE [Rhodospirillaceae bacterium]|nr:glycolate oxidase subunit GlcE [Rhodospirillaceae bacterium]
MVAVVKPADSKDLEEIISDALNAQKSLEISGTGSKSTLGHPMKVSQKVSLAGLNGITLYEPEELVLTARAGTPLADIESTLAQNHQELAFEPPSWGALLGNAEVQTLGGVIATNIGGPRRFRAGAPRDHLLGVSMVTGRGETVKTGGRVVKNVTGYDLCKLIAGSYGTLAVASELTVKVLPAGDKIRTVLVSGLDAREGVKVMTEVLASPYDVSAAAYITKEITKRSDVSYVSNSNATITAVRVEGAAPSVLARCRALKNLLRKNGDIEELHFHNSKRFWAEIGNVSPYIDEVGPVWKISVPPSNAVEIVKTICDKTDSEFYFDWGGGLIWVRIIDHHKDGGAHLVRAAINSCGGHATLIRASCDVRSCVPVFEPQGNAVTALTQRIKKGFDPAGILNPGRMSLLPRRDHAD